MINSGLGYVLWVMLVLPSGDVTTVRPSHTYETRALCQLGMVKTLVETDYDLLAMKCTEIQEI